MTKAMIKDPKRVEEITELVNIAKQLSPMSLALMQSNADILLARDKLEKQSRNPPKQTA